MNTLENLNKQILISSKIDIIIEHCLKLMDIVNENQTAVNKLKEELEKLKVHTDNATDQLDDDGDKYRDADIMINQ
mgnify:CR=1 FL=1